LIWEAGSTKFQNLTVLSAEQVASFVILSISSSVSGLEAEPAFFSSCSF